MRDADQLLVFDWWRIGAAVSFMKINVSIYPCTLITSYCKLPFALRQIPLMKTIVKSNCNGIQSLLHILALTKLTVWLRVPDWEDRERVITWEGMIYAWIVWWHVYFSDHHISKSHEYDGVCCLCVVCMCAWIMSKMGVCGSSLSRPRQLIDSFMPLCTKMSLSRARWEGRTSQTSIHSLSPQTNVSPFSINCALWVYSAQPQEHSDRAPHSSTASKCKSVTFIFSIDISESLVPCIMFFKLWNWKK